MLAGGPHPSGSSSPSSSMRIRGSRTNSRNASLPARARVRSRSCQPSSPQESLAADSRTERVNSGGKSPIPSSRPDLNKLRAPANKLHYQLRFSRPSCDPLGVYSCRAPILQIRETVRQLMLEPHRHRGEESSSRHGSRWPKTLRSELNPSQRITVVSISPVGLGRACWASTSPARN
jgi:hypothetical protein